MALDAHSLVFRKEIRMTQDFGDTLNTAVRYSINLLFEQGEIAQLTYLSLNQMVTNVADGNEESIEIDIPIGYHPNKNPMLSKKKFKKEDLIHKYKFLANTQLSINCTYQLVTIIEAMQNDLLFEIIKKFPKKISSKKMVSVKALLSADSTEGLLSNTIYSII